MEFKGKKVDWIVSSDDIIHIDISNNNADLCILTELTTEYKNEDLYNKNLASHAPEMLEMLETVIKDYHNIIPQSEARDNRMRQIQDLLTRATTI